MMVTKKNDILFLKGFIGSRFVKWLVKGGNNIIEGDSTYLEFSLFDSDEFEASDFSEYYILNQIISKWKSYFVIDKGINLSYLLIEKKSHSLSKSSIITF
jgi:hypothetical protein